MERVGDMAKGADADFWGEGSREREREREREIEREREEGERDSWIETPSEKNNGNVSDISYSWIRLLSVM